MPGHLPPGRRVGDPAAGRHPLRWRLLLGWHPESPAARVAEAVLDDAVAAYTDSLAAHPDYLAWLLRHPEFGARDTGTARPVPRVRTA